MSAYNSETRSVFDESLNDAIERDDDMMVSLTTDNTSLWKQETELSDNLANSRVPVSLSPRCDVLPSHISTGLRNPKSMSLGYEEEEKRVCQHQSSDANARKQPYNPSSFEKSVDRPSFDGRVAAAESVVASIPTKTALPTITAVTTTSVPAASTTTEALLNALVGTMVPGVTTTPSTAGSLPIIGSGSAGSDNTHTPHAVPIIANAHHTSTTPRTHTTAATPTAPLALHPAQSPPAMEHKATSTTTATTAPTRENMLLPNKAVASVDTAAAALSVGASLTVPLGHPLATSTAVVAAAPTKEPAVALNAATPTGIPTAASVERGGGAADTLTTRTSTGQTANAGAGRGAESATAVSVGGRARGLVHRASLPAESADATGASTGTSASPGATGGSGSGEAGVAAPPIGISISTNVASPSGDIEATTTTSTDSDIGKNPDADLDAAGTGVDIIKSFSRLLPSVPSVVTDVAQSGWVAATRLDAERSARTPTLAIDASMGGHTPATMSDADVGIHTPVTLLDVRANAAKHTDTTAAETAVDLGPDAFMADADTHLATGVNTTGIMVDTGTLVGPGSGVGGIAGAGAGGNRGISGTAADAASSPGIIAADAGVGTAAGSTAATASTAAVPGIGMSNTGPVIAGIMEAAHGDGADVAQGGACGARTGTGTAIGIVGTAHSGGNDEATARSSTSPNSAAAPTAASTPTSTSTPLAASESSVGAAFEPALGGSDAHVLPNSSEHVPARARSPAAGRESIQGVSLWVDHAPAGSIVHGEQGLVVPPVGAGFSLEMEDSTCAGVVDTTTTSTKATAVTAATAVDGRDRGHLNAAAGVVVGAGADADVDAADGNGGARGGAAVDVTVTRGRARGRGRGRGRGAGTGRGAGAGRPTSPSIGTGGAFGDAMCDDDDKVSTTTSDAASIAVGFGADQALLLRAHQDAMAMLRTSGGAGPVGVSGGTSGSGGANEAASFGSYGIGVMPGMAAPVCAPVAPPADTGMGTGVEAIAASMVGAWAIHAAAGTGMGSMVCGADLLHRAVADAGASASVGGGGVGGGVGAASGSGVRKAADEARIGQPAEAEVAEGAKAARTATALVSANAVVQRLGKKRKLYQHVDAAPAHQQHGDSSPIYNQSTSAVASDSLHAATVGVHSLATLREAGWYAGADSTGFDATAAYDRAGEVSGYNAATYNRVDPAGTCVADTPTNAAAIRIGVDAHAFTDSLPKRVCRRPSTDLDTTATTAATAAASPATPAVAVAQTPPTDVLVITDPPSTMVLVSPAASELPMSPAVTVATAPGASDATPLTPVTSEVAMSRGKRVRRARPLTTVDALGRLTTVAAQTPTSTSASASTLAPVTSVTNNANVNRININGTATAEASAAGTLQHFVPTDTSMHGAAGVQGFSDEQGHAVGEGVDDDEAGDEDAGRLGDTAVSAAVSAGVSAAGEGRGRWRGRGRGRGGGRGVGRGRRGGAVRGGGRTVHTDPDAQPHAHTRMPAETMADAEAAAGMRHEMAAVDVKVEEEGREPELVGRRARAGVPAAQAARGGGVSVKTQEGEELTVEREESSRSPAHALVDTAIRDTTPTVTGPPVATAVAAPAALLSMASSAGHVGSTHTGSTATHTMARKYSTTFTSDTHTAARDSSPGRTDANAMATAPTETDTTGMRVGVVGAASRHVDGDSANGGNENGHDGNGGGTSRMLRRPRLSMAQLLLHDAQLIYNTMERDRPTYQRGERRQAASEQGRVLGALGARGPRAAEGKEGSDGGAGGARSGTEGGAAGGGVGARRGAKARVARLQGGGGAGESDAAAGERGEAGETGEAAGAMADAVHRLSGRGSGVGRGLGGSTGGGGGRGLIAGDVGIQRSVDAPSDATRELRHAVNSVDGGDGAEAGVGKGGRGEGEGEGAEGAEGAGSAGGEWRGGASHAATAGDSNTNNAAAARPGPAFATGGGGTANTHGGSAVDRGGGGMGAGEDSGEDAYEDGDGDGVDGDMDDGAEEDEDEDADVDTSMSMRMGMDVDMGVDVSVCAGVGPPLVSLPVHSDPRVRGSTSTKKGVKETEKDGESFRFSLYSGNFSGNPLSPKVTSGKVSSPLSPSFTRPSTAAASPHAHTAHAHTQTHAPQSGVVLLGSSARVREYVCVLSCRGVSVCVEREVEGIGRGRVFRAAAVETVLGLLGRRGCGERGMQAGRAGGRGAGWGGEAAARVSGRGRGGGWQAEGSGAGDDGNEEGGVEGDEEEKEEVRERGSGSGKHSAINSNKHDGNVNKTPQKNHHKNNDSMDEFNARLLASVQERLRGLKKNDVVALERAAKGAVAMGVRDIGGGVDASTGMSMSAAAGLGRAGESGVLSVGTSLWLMQR